MKFRRPRAGSDWHRRTALGTRPEQKTDLAVELGNDPARLIHIGAAERRKGVKRPDIGGGGVLHLRMLRRLTVIFAPALYLECNVLLAPQKYPAVAYLASAYF